MMALSPDTWAPVPMTWEFVRPGDVVLDPNGSPWMVQHWDGAATWTLRRGAETAVRACYPSETVPTLRPLAEREAVRNLHEMGLGPRLLTPTG
jgi:hypothetical protein